MPVKAKYIKNLPLKKALDGSESLLVQDLNGTQQASLEVIVDEIKQNSQEKIREIESELAQTNAQLSGIDSRKVNNYHIRSSSNNPDSDTANLCLGSIHNMIASDLQGCVISGGGTSELWANVIGGDCDAVWQGEGEKRPNVTDGQPKLGTGANMSVITGGYDNVCNGLASMITGHHNYIREKATHAVISGGTKNKLDAGNYTGIGAGVNNRITGITSSGATDSSVYSYICGGLDNTIDTCNTAFIGAGQRCEITGKNHNSVIVGGIGNIIKNTGGYNQQGNFIGGGYTNVINNGSSNIIVGGRNNNVDGSRNVILGGQDNEISTSDAIVWGREAKATRQGEFLISNGKFSEVGDNGYTTFTLKETTTDGTYKTLLATLKDNTSVSYTIKIHAVNTNDILETCWYEVKGTIAKINGTVTRIGAEDISKYGANIVNTWNTYVVDSNYGLLLRVIGEADKTIRWMAKYDFLEISC